MTDATRLGLAQLSQPFYTYSDADLIADVGRGTSRRWLSGRRYRGLAGAGAGAAVTLQSEDGMREGVSFVDLIEIIAIGRLQRVGFSLRKLLEIVRLWQEQLGEEHPIAGVRFKTNGREIFVSRSADLLDVAHRHRTGLQIWNEVLGPYLDTLDYEDDVARRWWPLGREQFVVVDPEFGFGYPVIAGSGVRTEIILERFRAGDLVQQIADDFGVDTIEVQHALQFEAQRLRIAA